MGEDKQDLTAVATRPGDPGGQGRQLRAGLDGGRPRAAVTTTAQRLLAIFEKARDAILICDDDGRYLAANHAAGLLTGHTPEELTRLCLWDLTPPAMAEQGRAVWREFLARGELDGEYALLRRDGGEVQVEFRAVANIWPGAHMSMLRDVGRRKEQERLRQRDEDRLESLLRISQYRTASDQELLDYALEEAIGLTDSKFGYIYHYSEEHQEFVLNTWSRGVMAQCAVAQPQTVYDLHKTGVWGEAVRQRRPMVINDFGAPHPLKRGYPPGHVALRKFCTVPVIVDERIVAVAGVANKAADYDDADVRQLTLLMDSVWKMLERRRAEQRLEESERRFRTLVDSAPEAIFIQTDGRFAYVNQAAVRLYGAGAADDLLGAAVIERFHPDDRQKVRERIRDLNQAKLSVPLIEERILRLDGAVVDVEVSAVPFCYQGRDGALVFARDVSERKRAERAMRESEEMMRSIFRAAPIGIGVVSRRVLLDVNERFCEMTGYAKEEIIGQNAVMLYPTREEFDYVGAEKYRQIAERGTGTVETRFKRKDGRAIHVLMSSTPLNPSDLAAGVTFTALDITERKRDEQALRQSRDLLQSTIDSLSSHMAILDEHGAIIAVNAAWRKFGQSNGFGAQNHGVGENYLEICREARGNWSSEAPLVAQAIGDILAGRREFYYLEYPCHGPGEERWFALRMTSFASGGLLRVVMSHENITQRRHAENALRQSEEKFRLVYSASPDAININRVDDGLYLDINEGFTRLTGYTRDDVLGRSSLELNIWHDPADRQRLVAGLREKGYYDNLEAKFRRKDQSVGAALMSARLIEIGGQSCIISITRDISDMKRVADEKARLEAQLRQAQKMEAIGTLAGGIAHDFNNILGAIIGYTELAQELTREGASNADELAQVLRSADRARKLVQQILTFSRKVESDRRPLSLNKIVRQSVGMLEHTLPKMIRIETDLAADLRPVCADGNQIEQIILNIAGNAADAMPDGGRLLIETQNAILGEEYCRLHLDARPGQYAMLQISDTGRGMDQRTREQIFDPFFTTKEVGKGTGLGLAIVYGIVKDHGGHVSCYSEPDLGSTFKIFLPAQQGPDDQPPAGQELSVALLRGNETILLVDDEPDLRRLGVHVLASAGYNVLAAGSGEEALELFKASAGRIDLLVMDLGMPGMGGHRALKEILAIDPRAKVIIASGYAANGQVKASLQSGAAGYVAKPFRRVDLLLTARNVLDAK
ncbi:PAS domain S-box protein [Desulfarculus baarsii]